MEIQKNNNYNKLISSKDYPINFIIHKLEGDIKDKPTRTSIQIYKNKHIEDKFGIYMNHSFDPNCKIHNSCIQSIKDIKKGDELTFNYNENETKMACPFTDSISGKQVNGKSA